MPERDLVSSQAGLAAAISVESGPGLGEGTEPVRARSYWEQVWIRFRRDKVAMASGFFIIFLVLVAAFGGPIAAQLPRSRPERHLLHRRERRPAAGRAVDAHRRHPPSGPSDAVHPRRRRHARPRRVPAPALRGAGLARGRGAVDDRRHDNRDHHGRRRRLLPRLDRCRASRGSSRSRWRSRRCSSSSPSRRRSASG